MECWFADLRADLAVEVVVRANLRNALTGACPPQVSLSLNGVTNCSCGRLGQGGFIG